MGSTFLIWQSPGPIYDVRHHMLPPAEIKNGMGAFSRFSSKQNERRPVT